MKTRLLFYKKLLQLIIFFSCGLTLAQTQLSNTAQVSVLTCGTGADLYTTFGHSAFRIKDSTIGIDKVYNYGVYDFNAPNFITNFIKGKLIYMLSDSDTPFFLQQYYIENRWVKEQQLDLTLEDVQQIYNFLENNRLPENRNYHYKFLEDNCATIIIDVLNKNLKKKITFNIEYSAEGITHRSLIKDYTNQSKWMQVGLDLILGSVTDKKLTNEQFHFLPDYVFSSIENAIYQPSMGAAKKLVKKTEILLSQKTEAKKSNIFSPFIVSLLLFLIVAIITILNIKSGRRSRTLDFLFFFISGFLGVVILFCWVGTLHSPTYVNFNLLWLVPTNFIVAFWMLKKRLPKWIKNYNKVLLALIFILFIIGITSIQSFNIAFLPLIFVAILRLSYLIKTLK